MIFAKTERFPKNNKNQVQQNKRPTADDSAVGFRSVWFALSREIKGWGALPLHPNRFFEKKRRKKLSGMVVTSTYSVKKRSACRSASPR